MQYRIARHKDAIAVATALNAVYPSYVHEPRKPKGARLWRIAVLCRATGAFLTYARM